MARTLKDVNQVVKKWADNLSASGDSIRAGVNAVATAPGQTAATHKDQYLAGVQRSVDKWATRVAAVSLQQWKDDMLTKGLPRIATGANSGKRKYGAFLNLFFQYLQGLDSILNQNPRGSLEQNIARMVATVRFLSEFNAAAS